MEDSLADSAVVAHIRKVAASCPVVDNRPVVDHSYSLWSEAHNSAASLLYIPVAEKYWAVRTGLVVPEYTLILAALDNSIQDSDWCIEQDILAEKAAVDNLADLCIAVDPVQLEAL